MRSRFSSDATSSPNSSGFAGNWVSPCRLLINGKNAQDPSHSAVRKMICPSIVSGRKRQR